MKTLRNVTFFLSVCMGALALADDPSAAADLGGREPSIGHLQIQSYRIESPDKPLTTFLDRAYNPSETGSASVPASLSQRGITNREALRRAYQAVHDSQSKVREAVRQIMPDGRLTTGDSRDFTYIESYLNSGDGQKKIRDRVSPALNELKNSLSVLRRLQAQVAQASLKSIGNLYVLDHSYLAVHHWVKQMLARTDFISFDVIRALSGVNGSGSTVFDLASPVRTNKLIFNHPDTNLRALNENLEQVTRFEKEGVVFNTGNHRRTLTTENSAMNVPERIMVTKHMEKVSGVIRGAATLARRNGGKYIVPTITLAAAGLATASQAQEPQISSAESEPAAEINANTGSKGWAMPRVSQGAP